MEQLRTVDTPEGTQSYLLVKKRIKNLNLRVKGDGQVVLSVPVSCPDLRADQFVRDKWLWIRKILQVQREQVRLPPQPDSKQSLALLKSALDEVYPLIAPMGVTYPRLKVRAMKSQWGNCHWRQGYITLNTALARCPEPLRQYVALHELAHFLHPNHGPEFYSVMDILMPEWKIRRRELKKYAGALGQ